MNLFKRAKLLVVLSNSYHIPEGNVEHVQAVLEDLVAKFSVYRDMNAHELAAQGALMFARHRPVAANPYWLQAQRFAVQMYQKGKIRHWVFELLLEDWANIENAYVEVA